MLDPFAKATAKFLSQLIPTEQWPMSVDDLVEDLNQAIDPDTQDGEEFWQLVRMEARKITATVSGEKVSLVDE